MTKLKPWPNRLASTVDASWKLRSSCVYVWPWLARSWVDLRWLAMTCAPLGWGQIFTQVKKSFSPFGHLTHVNASWMPSINLFLANEIRDSLPHNVFFLRIACTCDETCESIWPTHASLYSSSLNLRPLVTTYRSIWPGLKKLVVYWFTPLLLAVRMRSHKSNERDFIRVKTFYKIVSIRGVHEPATKHD